MEILLDFQTCSRYTDASTTMMTHEYKCSQRPHFQRCPILTVPINCTLNAIKYGCASLPAFQRYLRLSTAASSLYG